MAGTLIVDSLHAAVRAHARSKPEETAIVESEGAIRMSWAGLWNAANAVADEWSSRGVERGARVVTILPPDANFAVALVAASVSGVCLVPMDLRFREADLCSVLQDVRIDAVVGITEFEGFEGLRAVADLCAVPGERTFDASQGPFWNAATRAGSADRFEGEPDDPLLIVFTGGSTGRPKGAVLTQQQITAACRIEYAAIGEHFERAETGETFVLSALPTSHVGGAAEIVAGSLIDGLSLVCLTEWHPVEAMKAQAKWRMPVIAGVPAMYAILTEMDLSEFDLSALQVAVCSGDRFSGALAAKVRDKLCPSILVSYGMTEANVLTLTAPDVGGDALDAGYVGRTLPGVEIRVGADDELVVRGPQVIERYLSDPETSASFTEDGWFRTGDQGRVEDGHVWVTGRLKQIIRVGSYTVLPHEVEAVALTFPDVATCAAVANPDERLGETVALFVQAATDERIDEAALRAHLAERLADFKRPRLIEFREALPRTRADKIDRGQLASELKGAVA